jgi:heptosyltransferase-3
MGSSPSNVSFYDQCRSARRLLVMDLGFLGDAIHLIPALNGLREALPDTAVDVVVADHVTGVLEVCPWLNRVYGYRRYPRSLPLWRQPAFIRRMRAGGYDAVINLNGSDRSSLLTRLSGARLRLGRTPPKVPWFWSLCFTHTVQIAYGQTPVYRQRWECLREAGFPVSEPRFAITLPPRALAEVDNVLGDARGYIHVSPSTTQMLKDLPEAVLVAFLNLLHERTGLPIVLSCAPVESEKLRMKRVTAALAFKPMAVLAGDLSLLGLAALISRAKVHCGGDSGALHVALMTGVPTVAWFRDYADKVEWLPQGKTHRVVTGESNTEGLRGIEAIALVDALQAVVN